MIPHMSLTLIHVAEKYQTTHCSVDKKKEFLHIFHYHDLCRFISSIIKWIKDFEVLMEWISNMLVLEKLVLIENAAQIMVMKYM
jgi:hypothetical protein